MRYCRTGPRAATPTVSPTSRPLFWAVPLSTTTCPGPVAHRPAVSESGFRRLAWGSKPKPNCPFWLEPSRLPSLAMSFVESDSPLRLKIAPVASATSPLARTRSSSEAGTVALPLTASLTTSRPEITALVFE